MSGKARKKTSFEERAERLQKADARRLREADEFFDEYYDVFDDIEASDAAEYWFEDEDQGDDEEDEVH